MSLPPFALEEYFAEWEFRFEHHLVASDAQSLPMAGLLALADEDDARDWDALVLGYTETRGAPAPRQAITASHARIRPEDVVVFAGPGEGLTAVYRALLSPEDHAIVVVPNYQSSESVPASNCATSGGALRPEDGWRLDVDAVAAALRPETTLVAVNFRTTRPVLSPTRTAGGRCSSSWPSATCTWSATRSTAAWTDPSVTLPHAADLYDKAVSINGVSKTYGLPGLRIGWVVTRDHNVLRRVEQVKHYRSICSAAPSEVLAQIAVKSRATLFTRSVARIEENLPLVRNFFDGYVELFDFAPPRRGCVCFVRYTGTEGVEAFCHDAVREACVILLPASVPRSELAAVPADRFRFELGRAGASSGVAALGRFVAARTASAGRAGQDRPGPSTWTSPACMPPSTSFSPRCARRPVAPVLAYAGKYLHYGSMIAQQDVLDPVFKALADPTRRLLLDRLRQQNGQTLTELCSSLEMARQSATQHLDLLAQANLVVVVRRGRERLHYLNPAPIHEIGERWIAAYDAPRLAALSTIRDRAEEYAMTETATTVPTYVYVTYIKATAEQVWKALTDADLTAQYWHHANVSDWQVGSPWEHRRVDGSGAVDVVGTVLEVEAPTRLTITFEVSPHEKRDNGPSVVTFLVEPHADIVRLTVTHENLPNVQMFNRMSSGWPAVLANLKSLLETGTVLPTALWEMPAVTTS